MISTPRSTRGRLFVAASALVAATSAAAQNTGAICGTVVDHTGQVVPGASVVLTSEATGDTRTIVSDNSGQFAFRAVEPGSYTINVELAGFRTLERKNNILILATGDGFDFTGGEGGCGRVRSIDATVRTPNLRTLEP